MKPKALKTMSIDDLVSEAYAIGHAHGGNAMRMAFGEPYQRLDDGWQPIANEIRRRLLRRQVKRAKG